MASLVVQKVGFGSVMPMTSSKNAFCEIICRKLADFELGDVQEAKESWKNWAKAFMGHVQYYFLPVPVCRWESGF